MHLGTKPSNHRNSLTPHSTCSFIGVTFTAIVMTIKAVQLHGSPAFKSQPIQLYPTSMIGGITCVSYSSLCFLCHFNILPLQKELHNPTKGRRNAVVVISLVTAYLLYSMVIFSGYFTVRVRVCMCVVCGGLIRYQLINVNSSMVT